MWKRVSWEARDEPFEVGQTRGKNERAKRADAFIVEGRGDDEDRVWDLAGVGWEWNTRTMDGGGGGGGREGKREKNRRPVSGQPPMNFRDKEESTSSVCYSTIELYIIKHATY